MEGGDEIPEEVQSIQDDESKTTNGAKDKRASALGQEEEAI